MLGFSPLGFLPLGFITLTPFIAVGGSMVVTTPGAGIQVEIGAANLSIAVQETFTVTPRKGGIAITAPATGMTISNA